jgi:hypothetical protein
MSGDLSVVTPSYRGDFERCRLLCETMDRFCTGYDRHLIVVDDEDAELFSRLSGPRRDIVATSALLPAFRIVGRWRGRWYRWRPGIGLPVYGWHLQQLRKIAVALAQPHERLLCIDSDVCFSRLADLSAFARSPRVPLFVHRRAITADKTRHVRWRANAYAALGLPAPELPGDDFIGQMIVWERASVRAMTERIAAAHARPWWQVLARQRDFSEYLTYGAAVSSDRSRAARHELTERSPCLAYWAGPPLAGPDIARLIEGLRRDQYALAVQSHTGTPIETIRSAILGP